MNRKQPTTPPQKTKVQARGEFLQSVYDDWVRNPKLNLVSICDKHSCTEESIRGWLRRRGLKRPDGIDRSAPSERYYWIMEGYNRGLLLELTAKQAADWAAEKSKTNVQRGDIQHYAAKFDLPLLRETDNGSFIGKYSKYG